MNNQKDGFGIFTFPNGTKLDGTWKQGKKHGRGTVYFAYGKILEGEWVEGKLQDSIINALEFEDT